MYLPMGSIKHLKIFCFIVTHFITNFFYFVPNRKASLESIYKYYIHLHILHTVNEFKENGQRNTIYMEEYATVHGLLSWSLVLLNLYYSNKYSSIFTHLIKHLINVFFSIPS